MAKVKQVQAGVNTTNGNVLAQGVGYKVASVKMPIRPTNKPWIPSWHAKHASNVMDT